jgi:hypothetical protein
MWNESCEVTFQKSKVELIFTAMKILLALILASVFWVIPVGPLTWGASWPPMLFFFLIVAILFSTPPPTYRMPVTANEKTEDGVKTLGATISLFIWLLIPFLLIAIAIAYLHY